MQSSYTNKAYSALLSPLTRACYMLKLRKFDTDSRVVDPDILMLVMNAREEIAAAESAHELQEIRRENDGVCVWFIDLIL